MPRFILSHLFTLLSAVIFLQICNCLSVSLSFSHSLCRSHQIFNKSWYNRVINSCVSSCSTFLISKIQTVTTLQARALTCLPCSLPEVVVRRSKLQGEICGTLLFQTPSYLIPSGLAPPRWVACSNSSNSESDINASATSHPKGQFDLQNMSDACLEQSVNQAWVSVFITKHYSMFV